MEIVLSMVMTMILVGCLASANEGWLLQHLNMFHRIILGGAGLALISPNPSINIGAIILAGGVLLLQLREMYSYKSVLSKLRI